MLTKGNTRLVLGRSVWGTGAYHSDTDRGHNHNGVEARYH